jgi:ribosomal protein L22
MPDERKRGSRPESGPADAAPEAEAKRQSAAKREAGAKSGAKGAAGSKAAAKTEQKGKQKSEARTKQSETKPATQKKTTTGKKADPEKAEKPAGSKAKSEAAKKTEGAGAKAAAKPKPKAKEADREAPTVRAKASYVRVAPRKARLVADQVRGLPIEDARTLLRFSPRSAARDLIKLIDSAAANAENNHDLIADELRIADIRVDEGPTLRRYRPRALGRATRINKRTSHIQVALIPEEE